MIILDQTIAEHPYLAGAIDCPGAVKIEQGIKLPNGDECWKKLLPESATVVPTPTGKSRMEKEGPGLWREYHLWALDPNRDPEFLFIGKLVVRLSCGTCKNHFVQILKEHPLDFSTPETCFAGTNLHHNLVNLSIGKPEMSVEDARKLYVSE